LARVLIIDDDPHIRAFLTDALTSDYVVFTARNGQDGIAAALEFRPDVVLCDIRMPDMNGIEVYCALQAYPQMSDVQFVFLSASDDHQTVRSVMSLGADDFLGKPVNVLELRRAVQARMEKRTRQQARLEQAMDELRYSITSALPHELRTAIMVMEGYAYLMLEEADSISDKHREMVEALEKNAARLRLMAEKYLWYLRVSMPDKEPMGGVTGNAGAVVQSTAQLVAERMERTADVYVRVGGAAVGIRTDFLARIVEELTENACKFSAPGTLVGVEAVREDDAYVVRVSSEGEPLTPEMAERIAGFVQFDRQRHEQQGTGLGLIVVKRLTELSGGQFAVHSHEGMNTVLVALPLVHSLQPV
jgi:two-component system, sensor histidine kinase and response regulator